MKQIIGASVSVSCVCAVFVSPCVRVCPKGLCVCTCVRTHANPGDVTSLAMTLLTS